MKQLNVTHLDCYNAYIVYDFDLIELSLRYFEIMFLFKTLRTAEFLSVLYF